MVESRSAGAAQVDLVVYPGAHHGFDIESLTMPRTVRLLPLFGPSATFFYDADAARDADQRVSAFLTENQ
jgi:dienelactone hydrolase